MLIVYLNISGFRKPDSYDRHDFFAIFFPAGMIMTGGFILRQSVFLLTVTGFCCGILIATLSFAGPNVQGSKYIGSKGCKPCHKKNIQKHKIRNQDQQIFIEI